MICNCYIKILDSLINCFVPFAVYKKVCYFCIGKRVVAFAAIFVQLLFEVGNCFLLRFYRSLISLVLFKDFRLLRKFIILCVFFYKFFKLAFCLAKFFFSFFNRFLFCFKKGIKDNLLWNKAAFPADYFWLLWLLFF